MKRISGSSQLHAIHPCILAQWQSIRGEFQVTDILVRSDLPLKLPKISETESLTLYSIPDPPKGR